MQGLHPRSARSIGAGVQAVLAIARPNAECQGQAVAAFRAGHYLRFGDAVFAIGDATMHAGPLHLVLDGQCPHIDEGERTMLSADRLWGRGLEIDLRSAELWAPPGPDHQSLCRTLPILENLAASLAPPVELAPQWPAVERAAEAQDFHGMRELLEGRGSGLTPVGDDVLAGILLVHAWVWRDNADILEVSAQAATTDLSRAFLHWAARGHAIEPVHRMVRYAESGQVRAAQECAAVVSSIGASSGEALITGLGLAARSVQRNESLRASRPLVTKPLRS